MTHTITLTRPDDWHVHLRQEPLLEHVVAHTASQFARAMVMPNLLPPVTTVNQALDYRSRIVSTLSPDSDFNPLMSLYLTDDTPLGEVQEAARCEHVVGFKLYPAGATTNSASGVTRISRVMPVLEQMARHAVVLQVHGEVTDPHIDIFDREAMFIEQVLLPIQRELPELKIVFEHVTTREATDFVRQAGDNVGATITVHHLLFSRNEIFRGGIRPHAYCLPVLKREQHRLALLEAATSADPSFFLGTDSAPHVRRSKEASCGCAGVYSAPVAMQLYAEVFEGMGALDRLEGFASHFGADFYGLPRNTGKLVLQKSDQAVPAGYTAAGDDDFVPLRAGESVSWTLVEG